MAVPRVTLIAASLVVLSSLFTAAKADYGNGTKPGAGKELPIAVQGIILCKSADDKYYPLQGATARVRCVKVEKGEKGKEIVPLTFVSCPTDAKGYFLAALNPSDLRTGRALKKCRVFLHRSSAADCHFATDVNRGVRGEPLSSSRILHDKQLRLFTSGPFVFTTQPTYY